MKIILAIFVTCVVATVVTLYLPGYGDLLLVFGPSALAAFLLLGRLFVQRRIRGSTVFIDGSNVMHWKDGKPGIEALLDVIDQVKSRGLKPAVVFDANAGYLLTGKYQHHGAMARHLGLSERMVMVVPKGEVADRFLLMAARDYQSPIVTNDRYRDWADDFPEVSNKGHLVAGGYRGGALWLSDF